jgi:hypothetical protein
MMKEGVSRKRKVEGTQISFSLCLSTDFLLSNSLFSFSVDNFLL